jgi:hypothetical protein
MTLNILASKLGGTLSTAFRNTTTFAPTANAAPVSIQWQNGCTLQSAVGLMEFVLFAFEQTKKARESYGGLGLPPSPPPTSSSVNAFFSCTDALTRPTTESMLAAYTTMGTFIAIYAASAVWDLQSAIRQAGIWIKDNRAETWNLNTCGPTVDWLTCNIIGTKSGRPFPY